MNEAQLQAFRLIAEQMHPEPHDWQWIGPHMSQRMFGISEARAKDYAARHGGTAALMVPFVDVSTVSEYGLTQKLSNSVRVF